MSYTYLVVDGRDIPADMATLDAGGLAAVDTLTINWGRRDTFDQPDTSTLSATLLTRDDTARAAALAHVIRPGSTITVNHGQGGGRDVTANAFDSVPKNTWIVGTYQPSQEFVPVSPRTFAAFDAALGRVKTGQTWRASATLALWVGVEARIDIWSWTTDPRRKDIPANPTKIHRGKPFKYSASKHPTTMIWEAAPVDYFLPKVTIPEPGTPDRPEYVTVNVVINPSTYPTFGDQYRAPLRWDVFAPYSMNWMNPYSTRVDHVRLWADQPNLTPALELFRGRVTTVKARPRTQGGLSLALTAADCYRELANSVVAAKPWDRTESVSIRASQILGHTPWKAPAHLITMPGYHSVLGSLMTWPRDSDTQTALSLLHELADGIGATLWCHEDERGTLQVRFVAAGRQTMDGAVRLPASAFRLDVEATRDPSAAISVIRIASTWPLANETTYYVVSDPARIEQVGRRVMNVTSQQTTSSDVPGDTTEIDGIPGQRWRLAQDLLACSPVDGWAMDGLTYMSKLDDNPEHLISLLQPGRREHLPVIIEGAAPTLPGGPDVKGYLAGGTATYQEGHWTISVHLTPPPEVRS